MIRIIHKIKLMKTGWVTNSFCRFLFMHDGIDSKQIYNRSGSGLFKDIPAVSVDSIDTYEQMLGYFTACLSFQHIPQNL